MLNFSGLECHASVWVCGSRAKYGQLSYKTHQKNIKEPRSWACCVVGRCWEHELLAGQLGQVRVLKWMLCLIQLAFCSISSTRNYLDISGSIGIMASKSASSSLLHQLETPSSPANSTNKSTTLVICGDKPCQVGSAHFDPHPCTNKIFTTPILGPFSKLFLSTSFNPFSTHFLAPECHPFFLEANQRNAPSPVCFTVRNGPPLEVLVRSAWPRSGLDPGAVLGRAAATSQKFELHGRVSNFWILHLIHLIFTEETTQKTSKHLIF